MSSRVYHHKDGGKMRVLGVVCSKCGHEETVENVSVDATPKPVQPEDAERAKALAHSVACTEDACTSPHVDEVTDLIAAALAAVRAEEREEIEALRDIIECKNALLVGYRTGRVPEKTWAKLAQAEKRLEILRARGSRS
jgi:hypothetical protein